MGLEKNWKSMTSWKPSIPSRMRTVKRVFTGFNNSKSVMTLAKTLSVDW